MRPTKESSGTVLRLFSARKPDDPLNQAMINRTAILFSPGFPLMGANDFAVVEDTSRPARPIVACTCYWNQRWSYGGIAFGLGRPEYVATLPEYRNRGLIRMLFEMIHARSADRGDSVQAITGIRYYYRQFGYEYALAWEAHAEFMWRRFLPRSRVYRESIACAEPPRMTHRTCWRCTTSAAAAAWCGVR